MDEGTEPVGDDEFLYRRISVLSGWYSPETRLKAAAFAPHKTEDQTGLSVWRAKYKTIEQAARGRAGKSYYVAILRAGDLRQRGIEVVPRPQPDDPGHAELPDLNSANRKTDRTRELQRILVELCCSVEGPFASP
jgi:hypothetical protein